MLTVTAAAGQHILGILQSRSIPTNVAARLNVEFGDLQIRLEETKAGDSLIAYLGRNIILLDPETATSLNDHTIDLVGSPVGPELVLRGPTGQAARM
jgi:Fe-S cluster assembly iron-binding protein IscA